MDSSTGSEIGSCSAPDAAHSGGPTRIVTAIFASCDGRRAPGVERGYVPGEMEADFGVPHRREGIPLNDATRSDLAAAAHRFDVTVPGNWQEIGRPT